MSFYFTHITRSNVNFGFISNDSPRLAMPAAGCQCLKSCSFKNKIKCCCILFDTGCGCTRGLNRVISNSLIKINRLKKNKCSLTELCKLM